MTALSKLAKFAMMTAETVEEAEAVLVMERQHASIQVSEAERALVALQRENSTLKTKVDEALGAEKPSSMAPDDASVTHEQVWELVKAWKAEGRKFQVIDLAQYFGCSPKRASVVFTYMKTVQPGFWSLFTKDGERGNHVTYVPVGYKPQVRERVVAMGTPSGTAVKVEP